MGPEVQFYLLYNSWNCLGVNALQRLIHKINWPEIHWSCRLSVLLYVCLTLSFLFFSSNTRTSSQTHTYPHALVFFGVSWNCHELELKEG